MIALEIGRIDGGNNGPLCLGANTPIVIGLLSGVNVVDIPCHPIVELCDKIEWLCDDFHSVLSWYKPVL